MISQKQYSFLFHYVIFSNYSNVLMTLQGFPIATLLSGISFTTTEPAPIVTLFPTCTGPMIVTLAPNDTLSPITGSPLTGRP